MGEKEKEVDVSLCNGDSGLGFWLWLCMVMESNVSGFIRDFDHREVELILVS